MKIDTTMLGYGFLFGVIILLDRITKYAAQTMVHDYSFNRWLTFTLHYNRGISWGLLHSESTLIYALVTLTIALFACFFFMYTIAQSLNGNSIIGELMVCAGAVSNIIDRVCYDGVVDFVLFSIGSWSWPVFNVADMFIVLGLMSMIYSGMVNAKTA